MAELPIALIISVAMLCVTALLITSMILDARK